MDTKTATCRTAFKMFIERGFTDVSVNDIISEAGITKGGFYHHFKSKEQLIICVFTMYIYDYFEIALREINSTGSTAAEKLKIFCERLLGYDQYIYSILEDENINFNKFYLLLMEGIKKYDFILNFRKKVQNQVKVLLANALHEGKCLGAIDESVDTDIIVRDVLARSEGAVLLKLLDENIELKKEIEKTINAYVFS